MQYCVYITVLRTVFVAATFVYILIVLVSPFGWLDLSGL